MDRSGERCRRGVLEDRRQRPLGVERAGDDHRAAGQQRTGGEAQRCGVVERPDLHVGVGWPEAPQVDLLGPQRFGIGLGEHPGVDTLGTSGRAGGVGHRAAERPAGQRGFPMVVRRLAHFGLAHHQRRSAVVEDVGTLVLEQRRVDQHRDDSRAQRTDGDGQVVEAARRDHRHPVARRRSGIGQPGGRPGLGTGGRCAVGEHLPRHRLRLLARAHTVNLPGSLSTHRAQPADGSRRAARPTSYARRPWSSAL